ncbi:hypothetical protein BV20DRAFT_418558 [Pilatotrama ljubarskyi]|nr:hypothetical protein BV20DRAFT_418558 [Pilatotrama ljubarskyi]
MPRRAASFSTCPACLFCFAHGRAHVTTSHRQASSARRATMSAMDIGYVVVVYKGESGRAPTLVLLAYPRGPTPSSVFGAPFQNEHASRGCEPCPSSPGSTKQSTRRASEDNLRRLNSIDISSLVDRPPPSTAISINDHRSQVPSHYLNSPIHPYTSH